MHAAQTKADAATPSTLCTARVPAFLTDRYTRALDHARIAHAAQVRKGSGIPYLYHLLAVSSLVLEFGGTEDQAIAGLLHDVIEDCGAVHEHIIRAQFGAAVAEIVVGCTDGDAEAKSQAHAADAEQRRVDWQRRKVRYIQHLAHAPDATLLVSACDKLHNARAIVQDLQTVGVAVFDRFTGGREGTLAYYHSLATVVTARGVAPAPVLDGAVATMHALAGAQQRCALV